MLQIAFMQRANAAIVLDRCEKNRILEDLGCVHSPWPPNISDVHHHGSSALSFCTCCQHRQRNKPGHYLSGAGDLVQSVSALLLSKCCHRSTEEGICKLNCCCCFHMRSNTAGLTHPHELLDHADQATVCGGFAPRRFKPSCLRLCSVAAN